MEGNISIKVEFGCSVTECLCLNGRNQSIEGTEWQVVLCNICKYLGTHKRCSDLHLMINKWECDACQNTLVKEETFEVELDNDNSFYPLQMCKTEKGDDYPRDIDSDELTDDTTTNSNGRTSQPVQIQIEYLDEDGRRTEENKIPDKLPLSHSKNVPKGKPYKCEYDGCSFSFNLRIQLETHRRIHTGEPARRCRHVGCKPTMKQLGCLKTRLLIPPPSQWGDDARKAALSQLASLETHTDEKPYKCDRKGCNSSFKLSEKLATHRRVHIEDNLYKCDYDGCNSTFGYLHAFNLHRRTHPEEKVHKCDFDGCTLAYTASSSLKIHRRTHTGEKPYKCDYEGCNSAFTRSPNLKAHRLSHTGVTPYHCEYKGCKAAFTRPNNLSVHYRTHTGGKPYKCKFDGCNLAFSYSNSLKTHSRTHTGEKPYKCDFEGCTCAFAQSGNLVIHRRTHTEEKPYKCDYNGCDRGFNQSGNLEKHRRSHIRKSEKYLASSMDDDFNTDFT